mgnify:FL=1
MTERIELTAPLGRWQGERGTYHLVTITGAEAEALQAHEAMHRLEFGARRGFGSVKVTARIGDTEWPTSVFPQKQRSEWVLLVSKKVMRSEDLAEGDPVELTLEPL